MNSPATLSPLGRAAIAYAIRFGWSVLPCRPGGKEPIGSLVPRGVLDATNDPELIRRLWSSAPTANVAVAVGVSGLVVIDVDRHGVDGEVSLSELELVHGCLPETVLGLTGGGGRHVLFRAPRDRILRAMPLAPGVDVKSGNGYIVVAPSLHATGQRYAWDAAHHPVETPVAEVPSWIVEQLESVARPVGARACPVTESALARAFAAARMLIRVIDNSRAAVVCPWSRLHTTGRPGDSSTIIFAPRVGSDLGWFWCSHEHCRGRRLEEVLAALPGHAVPRSCRQVVQDAAWERLVVSEVRRAFA